MKSDEDEQQNEYGASSSYYSLTRRHGGTEARRLEIGRILFELVQISFWFGIMMKRGLAESLGEIQRDGKCLVKGWRVFGKGMERPGLWDIPVTDVRAWSAFDLFRCSLSEKKEEASLCSGLLIAAEWQQTFAQVVAHCPTAAILECSYVGRDDFCLLNPA